VNLYVPAKPPHVIFEASACGFEGVVNRYIHVLVWRDRFQVLDPFTGVALRERAAEVRRMVYHDFLPRHPQINSELKGRAPLVMPVRCLDNHAATGDAVEVSVQLGSFSSNSGSNCL
jgi:hypothetical protein